LLRCNDVFLRQAPRLLKRSHHLSKLSLLLLSRALIPASVYKASNIPREFRQGALLSEHLCKLKGDVWVGHVRVPDTL
jgi:hypothetical protein